MNFVKSSTTWHTQWCMESNYGTFLLWSNASPHYTLQLHFHQNTTPMYSQNLYLEMQRYNEQSTKMSCDPRKTNIWHQHCLSYSSWRQPFPQHSFIYFFCIILFKFHPTLFLKHNTYLQQCNNYSNKGSSKKMLQ